MLNFLWNSLLLFACVTTYVYSSSDAISARNRRFLIYPSESTAEVIMGFGLPILVQEQSLTVGIVIQLIYDDPIEASHFSDAIFGRKGRSTSRWELYSRLEAGCDSLGMDGKACVLRAICEAADVTLKYSGLAGEMLHVFFTPSSTSDPPRRYMDTEYYAAERLGATVPGSCHLLYPECNTGLLDFISTIETV